MRRLIGIAGILALCAGTGYGDDSPFGINAHIASYPPDALREEVLDSIVGCGIKWISCTFSWKDVQPELSSQWNWGVYDSIVSWCDARDINIVAKLFHTPKWASDSSSHLYYRLFPPADIDDWREFVDSVVTRYKGTVKYWEIWNEPNIEWLLVTGDTTAKNKAQQYVARLLSPAYEKIHDVCSDCGVVGPATDWFIYRRDHDACRSRIDRDWFNEFVARGGLDSVDVLSFHSYLPRYLPELGVPAMFDTLQMARDSVKNHGIYKKFWITETGWNVHPVWPPDTNSDWRFTEAEQAECYTKMCREVIKRDWIEKVFFFETKDPSHYRKGHHSEDVWWDWTEYWEHGSKGDVALENYEPYVWKGDYSCLMENSDTTESTFLITKSRSMECETNTTYKASVYLRTEDVQPTTPGSGLKGARWSIKLLNGTEADSSSDTTLGTTPWFKDSLAFNTGDHDAMDLRLRLAFATGQVWYDDILITGPGNDTIFRNTLEKVVGKFGILDWDMKPKPAFGSYKHFIDDYTSPPTVTVMTPDGGDKLEAGTYYTIGWEAQDNFWVDTIKIYFYANYPDTSCTLIHTEPGTGSTHNSSFSWLVPDSISDSCRIKIVAMDSTGATTFDISDGDFSVWQLVSGTQEATAYNNQRALQSDPDGNLHLVFSDTNIVRYAKSEDIGESWLSKDAIIVGQGKYPALAVGGDGSVHVCWLSDEGLHYRKGTSAGWEDPHLLVSKGNKHFSPPGIAVHGNIVHLVFQHGYTVKAEEWHHQLYHYQFTDPQDVTAFPIDAFQATEFVPAYPCIELTQGRPHICWERQGDILYRYHSGGGWSGEMNVFETLGDCHYPCLEIWENPWTEHRSVHIACQEGGPDYTVLHKRGCIRDQVFWLQQVAVTYDEVILGDARCVSTTASEPAEHPRIVAGSQALWRCSSDGNIYRARYDGCDWQSLGPITSGEEYYFPQGARGIPEVAGTFPMHCVYTKQGTPCKVIHEIRGALLSPLYSPIVVSARDGDTISLTDPMLAWEDVGADSFTVEYSVDPSFSMCREITGHTNTDYPITDDTLFNDCMIWWRITAFKDTIQRISDVDSFFWDLPTTYWVDGATGDDNDPGTRSAPWATIQHAADVMGPWSRTWVIAGIYDEEISCNITAKPDSQIVFQAYPGNEGPAIVGGQGTNLFGFQLRGVSHIVIDGFEMQNQSTAAIDIASYSGVASSQNVAKNLDITSADVLNCIHISGDTGCPCYGNRIENIDMTLDDGFYAVKLVNAPNTELINCGITGASAGPSYGVSVQQGCDSISMRGGSVSSVTSYGFHAQSGNDGLEITDNTFHNAGENAAVYLSQNKDAIVTGNRVDSTQATATIWLDTKCYNSIVSDNVITMNLPNSGFGIRLRYDNDSVLVSGNTITGGKDHGSAGIYLDWKNSNVEITGNSVDSSMTKGAVIGGTGADNDDVWVTGNSISATDIGIHIEKRTQERTRIVNNFLHSSNHCVFNYGGETAFIAHNSIYTETGTGIFVDQNTGSTDDCTLRNNVVYSGSGYCLKLNLFFSPDGWDSDYNDLYTETGNVGRWGNTDTPTLSNWQSESDGDQHSISADPLFVSVSETNLHITENSPCRNIATPISWITNDFDGELRDSLRDLGADEWYEQTGGGTMAGTIANIPIIFRLKQNRPNPFRRLTTIDYSIPRAAKVTLRVYDVTGRMVKELVNREQKAGMHTVTWKGKTPRSKTLATGVYFVRLCADSKTATKKLILVR